MIESKKGVGSACTTAANPPSLTVEEPALDTIGSSSVTSDVLATITVGIDMVSIAWLHELPLDITRQLRPENGRVTIAGREFRQTYGQALLGLERVEGLAYGLRPGRDRGRGGPSTLWVEGRAVRAPGQLAGIDDVLCMTARAERFWRELGCDPYGVMVAQVRRIDLAADIRPHDREEGTQLLADLARTPLVRGQRQRTWREPYTTGEHVSGIDIMTATARGQRVELRVYCKATEQARRGQRPDRPGTWVRIERQIRYESGSRPRLHDALVPEALGEAWREPLCELLRPTVTTQQAVERVLDAHRAGHLDVPTARRLIGYITLRAIAPEVRSSASTEARAAGQLAALDIQRVSDTTMAPRTHDLLLAASASWNQLRPASIHHNDLLLFEADPDAALI